MHCILYFFVLQLCYGAMAAAGVGDGRAEAAPDVPDFWPEVKGDLRRVTWAHAVNSRAELDAALQSTTMMLEADVSIGEDGSTPIMAHPPSQTSDLTLKQFVDAVQRAVANNKRKGVKLDFKTKEAVERAVPVLEDAEMRGEMKFPVWLNADIVAGPNGALEPNVSAARFLQLCKDKFPARTISVGWTTGFNAERYTEQHVQNMRDALSGIAPEAERPPITFAVRAQPAAMSADTLLSLLQERPHATLTIWGAAVDQVNNTALVNMAKKAGFDRVYVDLPNPVPGLTSVAPGATPMAPAWMPLLAAAAATALAAALHGF